MYTKDQILKLKEYCTTNIIDILEILSIDYNDLGYSVRLPCPIHEGNNPTACVIYVDSGNWLCNTKKCHEEQKYSSWGILGFLRGVYESRNGNISFQKFLQVLEKKLKINRTSLEKISIKEKPKQEKRLVQNRICSLNYFRKMLDIPADYYIRRGYCPDTLRSFSVGISKKYKNGVIVPVLDMGCKDVIGYLKRATCKECSCGLYHDKKVSCQQAQDKAYIYSKWTNNKGFKAGEYLYNLWNADKYIRKSKVVVVVESCGNVWKLYEHGIKNVVGLFGSSFTSAQEKLFQSCGALSFIILTDNDDAGNKCAEKINRKFGQIYKLYRPKFDTNDIAELSDKQLKSDILPMIDHVMKGYK